MNYKQEYAILVSRIDRVASILEQYKPDDPIIREADALLVAAIQEAEERYIAQN